MTPAGFLADNGLYIISGSARAPRGYTWEYAGFYASLNQDGYIGMLNLATYNVTECSAQCDSITGCKGFSIYYERSPTQNPASECPNPSMQTTIRCTFYNAAVDYQKATNIGEWRNQFAVVITGANGYSKL
ncbi:hypothetical protein BDZ85DRAFT_279874 [Elsinoe ampelina]|uniref:Apple domain-containing protein n=1 Tax=Elsinoe ampelina TaxID=302913 RepID=A0A6A6GG46_9PEZI|nr:hypothetical protein BDZ85DRAFT_279874 [Elsinoe ampelina]